jgi:hypothetical protein
MYECNMLAGIQPQPGQIHLILGVNRPADADGTSGTNIDLFGGGPDRSWQSFVTFLELNVVASKLN